MASVTFRCGACKRHTASAPLAWNTVPQDEADETLGWYPMQVCVRCTECQQLSTLHYAWPQSGPRETRGTRDYCLRVFEDDLPETVTLEAQIQWPALAAPPANGLWRAHEIQQAWREAERAFIDGQLWTAANMAYRRVLELGVKRFDKTPASREMLGQRLNRLRQSNVITTELYELIMAAKAFGDDAAHGTDAMDENDAAIARDLCDAFLRQAFTVPYLLQQAKDHMSEKAKAKADKQKAIEALRQRAQQAREGIAERAAKDSDGQ